MDEQQPEDLSRSDLRLVGAALRNDWPIPPDVKTRLLQAAINIADIDNPDDIKPAPSAGRRLAALRVIAAFCKLALGQQALDLARERHEGGKASDVPLADVVREAERRAEERIREREQERAGE